VYDIFISLADNNNLHVWHCHMFHTVCDVEWLLYCIHFHQMFPKCQHILISPNPKSKYKTKFKFRIKNSSYYFNTVIDIYEIFKYLYNIIAIEQQHILHHYNFFSQNTFTQSVLQTLPEHMLQTLPKHLFQTLHEHLFQTLPEHMFQTLPEHMFQTQTWLSKHSVKQVWWVHQILKGSWFSV
jgi:hypothetical protein